MCCSIPHFLSQNLPSHNIARLIRHLWQFHLVYRGKVAEPQGSRITDSIRLIQNEYRFILKQYRID